MSCQSFIRRRTRRSQRSIRTGGVRTIVTKVRNAFVRPGFMSRYHLLRILPNGGHGPLCTSRCPLPSPQPPRTGMIVLLEPPTSAKLHNPVHARLRIRNYHPSRSASLTVRLEPDAADAFLIAGQRSARVSMLLPSTEVRLIWSLIPSSAGSYGCQGSASISEIQDHLRLLMASKRRLQKTRVPGASLRFVQGRKMTLMVSIRGVLGQYCISSAVTYIWYGGS